MKKRALQGSEKQAGRRRITRILNVTLITESRIITRLRLRPSRRFLDHMRSGWVCRLRTPRFTALTLDEDLRLLATRDEAKIAATYRARALTSVPACIHDEGIQDEPRMHWPAPTNPPRQGW